MGDIRICCNRGKYTYYRVKLDDEQEVDKIIEEVDLYGDDRKALIRLTEQLIQAATLPVLVMNDGNTKLLKAD